MKKIFIALVCLMLATPLAEARIIDYPGGWTVMQMNDGENNSLHLHYSPAFFYSVGYALDYWREEKWTMHAGQAAWLLKRWNEPDAQANLYARGALGAAFSDHEEFDDKVEPAGFAGVVFDAENRRYYVSYEGRYTEAGDIFGGFEQKARVGVAPYVAEYGSLHTWIILQVDHRPESEDTLVFTPMLRFFKGDLLMEVGVSDSEELLLNLIVRF